MSRQVDIDALTLELDAQQAVVDKLSQQHWMLRKLRQRAENVVLRHDAGVISFPGAQTTKSAKLLADQVEIHATWRNAVAKRDAIKAQIAQLASEMQYEERVARRGVDYAIAPRPTRIVRDGIHIGDTLEYSIIVKGRDTACVKRDYLLLRDWRCAEHPHWQPITVTPIAPVEDTIQEYTANGVSAWTSQFTYGETDCRSTIKYSQCTGTGTLHAIKSALGIKWNIPRFRCQDFRRDVVECNRDCGTQSGKWPQRIVNPDSKWNRKFGDRSYHKVSALSSTTMRSDDLPSGTTIAQSIVICDDDSTGLDQAFDYTLQGLRSEGLAEDIESVTASFEALAAHYAAQRDITRAACVGAHDAALNRNRKLNATPERREYNRLQKAASRASVNEFDDLLAVKDTNLAAALS